MSTDLRRAVTLDDLVAMLDPAVLRRQFDTPVDAVTRAFLARKPRARTTAEFNRVIVRFVRAIHARALPFARILSTAEAYAIAVRMLHRAYDPAGSHGYELALLAVVRENRETIDSVLSAIADGIKQNEREKYRRWIHVRFVEGLSWAEKCALAAEVIREESPGSEPSDFPPDPACLAAHLPELIDAYVTAVTAAYDLSPRQHPILPPQIPSGKPIALQ